jgi:NADPH:quinone reductase-like Zn-dependent oxidoreductase
VDRPERIEGFGRPEVLRERVVRVPVPGEGEVLIKAAAAGANPLDYKIWSGKHPAVKQGMLPYVLGRDVSGAVVELGSATRRKGA